MMRSCVASKYRNRLGAAVALVVLLAALLFGAGHIVTADEGPAFNALRQHFAAPPAEWKSRPLWFWNGPVDKQKTTEIMERSVASGYHGFGILPTTDMGMAFMSPEFLAQYRHAVDTAARLGMHMCLYDEFWFPSGSAGDLLAKQYPEALSKRLDKVEHEVTGPGEVKLPVPAGDLMAVVAMRTDAPTRVDLASAVNAGQLTWQVPEGAWRIMFFVCVTDGNRGLVDYLDPASVRRFAELTYDKYYETFPEHFGRTIDSAFYDEPTFHWVQGGRAWTPAFNERYRAKYGVDPTLDYPALWYDVGPDTAAARNRLFGLRAELFSLGFVKTLADWCREHKIQLTGHVDQEEIVNPVGLCGDLIKVFEYQQMPGLDQIFQYDRGSPMYKVVSSAAVNYGHQTVMTECYGAIDLPLPNLYREAMDQFVKGVNLMVPHAVWYRSDKITFPPELSYRTEPYASELPRYNEYVGRLQRVLRPGRPVVDIAVLYPIQGLQAAYYFGPGEPYKGGVIPEWADYMEVGERLSFDLRQDFTYLHPETLDNRCEVADGQIHLQVQANPQAYRVLILPGTEAMSVSNLEKIKAFYDRGGQVIATTRLPDKATKPGRNDEVRALVLALFGEAAVQGAAGGAAASEGAVVAPHKNAAGGAAWFVPRPTAGALQAAVAAALPVPDVAWTESVSVTGGHLACLHEVVAGRDVWFFANSSDTPIDTTILLRGEHRLERWDPHSGRIEACAAKSEAGRTRVSLQLNPVSSLFFVAQPQD